MKKILLLISLTALAFSAPSCPVSDGYYWKYSSTNTFSGSSSTYPVASADYCSATLATHDVLVDIVQSDTLSYTYSVNREYYTPSLEIVCPDGETIDTSVNPHVCISAPPPPPSCPPNSTYDYNQEKCLCDISYSSEYSLDGSLICVAPTCTPTYEINNDILPLFAQVQVPNHCSFFPLGNYAEVTAGDVVCCYGQEDINRTGECPPNTISLGGECIPVTSSNSSDTPSSHECPSQYYWSYMSEQCEPFFPDDNSTDDPNPHDNPGLGSGSDSDNDNIPDSLEDFSLTDYLDGGGDGSEYGINIDGVSNSLTSVLNSYALISVPVTASGTCSGDFSPSFYDGTTKKTYTVDAQKGMDTFNDFVPIIKYFIMFVSSVSAVILLFIGGL